MNFPKNSLGNPVLSLPGCIAHHTPSRTLLLQLEGRRNGCRTCVVYRGQSCEMTGRLGPLTREIRVLPKNYHTLRHSLGCFDHSLHSKILGFRVKFPFSQSLVDVHLTYLSYLLYFTLLLVVFLPILLSFHIPNPRLVQGPPPPLARLVPLVRWVHLREAPRLNIT